MYLDSAILVKLVIRENDTPFFSDLVDGGRNVWSSELAITECWSALARKEREGSLRAADRRTAWVWFESYIGDKGLRLQPVNATILRLANRTIDGCRDHANIRTLDAIHLATCQFREAFPMQTTDRTMRAAAAALNIPLGPLPTAANRQQGPRDA